MLKLDLFYPEFEQDKDYFPTKFSWLAGDWSALTWPIVDPISAHAPIAHDVIWGGVLGPNLRFEDCPDIISDMKRSLALAADQRLGGQPRLTGAGTIRGRALSLKRVYRELYDMGLSSLSDLREYDLKELVTRLSLNASVSCDYSQKLADYFDSQPLVEIPVVRNDTGKTGARIDMDSVCLDLGIHVYGLRKSLACTRLKYEMHKALSKHYGIPFTTPQSEKLTEEPLPASNMFKAHIKALKALILHSSVEGLLQEPSVVTLEDLDQAHIGAVLYALPTTVGDSSGRTRNIPVDSFLTLMDRAVRWVVDYGEPLLDLHDRAIEEWNSYSADMPHQGRVRQINAWLKQETQTHSLVGSIASPFPLKGWGGSGPDQLHKSPFTRDELASIRQMHAEGLKAKAIAEEIGHDRVAVQNYIGKSNHCGYHFDTTDIGLKETLFNHLPTACACVLFAFTAGRESSIYGLRPNCIKLDRGELYIELYVPKTTRRLERLPAVAIMDKAVEILTRLSAYSLEVHGEPRNRRPLFSYDSPILSAAKPSPYRFDNAVIYFCKMAGIDARGFGFSEHQFRRFFAIMYFWRYELGEDLEALSFQLRHISYEMTAQYLTEKEMGRILKEVQREKTQRYAQRKQMGDESLQGEMAQTLMAEFKNELELLAESEQDYISVDYESEDSHIIDFSPNGDLCFGRTPRFKEKANCKLVDDAGEIHIRIHRASDSLCNGCQCQLRVAEVKGGVIPLKAAEELFRADTCVVGAAAKQAEAGHV